MLKQIKSKLWFVYRGFVWMKDNFFDNVKIHQEWIYSFPTVIWKTWNWDEILCYTFGEWKEKILYFWWIHGNEVGTVKLMNHWVNYMWENFWKNENIHSLQGKQVFIIPCLNLDWYKQALKNSDYFNGWVIWKINANNVDLNRNFPTSNWSVQSKLFAAGKYSDISWGEFAWSEPEIQALLSLIEKEKIKTIYTFHNCWWTVFWKGTKNVEKKVQSYSEKSWYRIFTDSEWEDLQLEQKTGHMMMWAEEKWIDVIEIETRTRWWSEWKQNKKALIESVKL